MAVAAGVPFLGLATRPARVLLVDYENGFADTNRILEQQRKHLGLPAYPEATFLFWPASNRTSHEEISQVLRVMAPDLVILDSLRSFCPGFESGNANAAEELKKLRILAADRGTSVLLVHHVNKKTARGTPALESSTAIDWLMNAAGARALINQTDARLAVDKRFGRAIWTSGPDQLRPHAELAGSRADHPAERVREVALTRES